MPELPVGAEDGPLEVIRQAGRQHQGPGCPSGRLQGPEIVAIETIEQTPQGLPQLVGVQKGAIGMGRGGKAPRDPHPFGAQFPQQFTQGGVLAPHGRDRLQPSSLEGQDQRGTGRRGTRMAGSNGAGSCHDRHRAPQSD